jgi:hypothetical protein
MTKPSPFSSTTSVFAEKLTAPCRPRR